MIATRIGIVLCRVGAAVLTVQAIRSLGYTVPGLLNGYDEFGGEILLFSLMTFVPGLAAIGLWVFADRICTIPEHSENDAEVEQLRNIDFLMIGTSLIGVYLMISGFIYAVNIEVANWLQPDFGSEYQNMIDKEHARTIASRTSSIAQIVAGTALILGRHRLSQFLSRAQYAGTGAS